MNAPEACLVRIICLSVLVAVKKKQRGLSQFTWWFCLRDLDAFPFMVENRLRLFFFVVVVVASPLPETSTTTAAVAVLRVERLKGGAWPMVEWIFKASNE